MWYTCCAILHPRPRAQVVIGIAPQNPKYVPVQKPTEVVLEGDWGSTPIVKHPMSKKVSVHSTEISLAATAHLQKVRPAPTVIGLAPFFSSASAENKKSDSFACSWMWTTCRSSTSTRRSTSSS